MKKWQDCTFLILIKRQEGRTKPSCQFTHSIQRDVGHPILLLIIRHRKTQTFKWRICQSFHIYTFSDIKQPLLHTFSDINPPQSYTFSDIKTNKSYIFSEIGTLFRKKGHKICCRMSRLSSCQYISRSYCNLGISPIGKASQISISVRKKVTITHQSSLLNVYNLLIIN